MTTYELTYHIVEPAPYSEPKTYARFERIEAESLGQALEQMDEVLDLERYFYPVIFGSFKLVSSKLENILPRVARVQ